MRPAPASDPSSQNWSLNQGYGAPNAVEPVDKTPPARDCVELRVCADATQLSLIRAVATNVAGREDFDLDAIADITMAVDELCSMLITRSIPGAVLDCRFEVRETALCISTAVSSASPEPISQNDFAWRVLAALGDTVTTWVIPGTDRHTVHTEFVKNRTDGSQAR